MLNAQKLHCWGSDKDIIFAPTILTLLLLWRYPSLSTQTFRIKSDPKSTMLNALCSQKSSISKMTELHCSLKLSPPSPRSVLILFLHLQFAQSFVLLFSSRQLMSSPRTRALHVYVSGCVCIFFYICIYVIYTYMCVSV